MTIQARVEQPNTTKEKTWRREDDAPLENSFYALSLTQYDEPTSSMKQVAQQRMNESCVLRTQHPTLEIRMKISAAGIESLALLAEISEIFYAIENKYLLDDCSVICNSSRTHGIVIDNPDDAGHQRRDRFGAAGPSDRCFANTAP